MSNVKEVYQQRAAVFVGEIKTEARVIVGIDFGTAYSGISFMYRDTPDMVYCGAPGASTTEAKKVPTVLYKGPEGWAFGKEAISKYNRALQNYNGDKETSAERLQEMQISLFRGFKMVLKEKTFGDFDDWEAPSTTGDYHSLMELVQQSLRCLADFARKKVMEGFGSIMELGEGDILWVLTVPAIWNDYGKAFMRRAALEAGLIDDETSDHLLLALEPESASLAVHNEASRRGLFDVGATFMILDCGGGTVDITLHKVATKEPLVLDELAAPKGGPWGGQVVDDAFHSFLQDLFGADLFDQMERQCPAEISAAVDEFRVQKEGLDPAVDEPIRISLEDLYLEAQDLDIPDLLSLLTEYNHRQNDPEVLFPLTGKSTLNQLKRHKITFTKRQFLAFFFEPTLKKTCDTVSGILTGVEVDVIAVVGGYGASKALSERIRMEFHVEGKRSVIVPDMPQTAVVLGAVYFGLYTEVVGSRISRFTYGVASTIVWQPGCGYLEADAVYDDDLKCKVVKDVFSIILQSETRIEPTQRFTQGPYHPLREGQTEMIFTIYKCPRYKPRRVSDDDCTVLGDLTVPCRDLSEKFRVEFSFTTEFMVEVIREVNGEKFHKTIDMKTATS